MNNEKQVSLIIPTYNKCERLKLMLRSLFGVVGIEKVEIIVIDDGSTDETQQLLKEFSKNKQFNFKTIRITNSGRSYARNVGIKKAEGNILIFTDDDLILDRMFVKEHVKMHHHGDLLVHGCIYNLPFLKFFKDPAAGSMVDGKERVGLKKYIITEKMILNDMKTIKKFRRLSKFEKDIQELLQVTDLNKDSKYRWISCTGGNISLSKRHIEKLGGFDENLGRTWGCEDLELGYRLSKIGVKFALCMEAANYHLDHYRENSQLKHRQAFNYFCKKHQDAQLQGLDEYFEGEIISLKRWWERELNRNNAARSILNTQ